MVVEWASTFLCPAADAVTCMTVSKNMFLRPSIHELIVEVFRFVIEPCTRILFEFEKKPTRSKQSLKQLHLYLLSKRKLNDTRVSMRFFTISQQQEWTYRLVLRYNSSLRCHMHDSVKRHLLRRCLHKSIVEVFLFRTRTIYYNIVRMSKETNTFQSRAWSNCTCNWFLTKH